MKKFSERINADWYTVERLEGLLNEFFEDYTEPKTLTHLYAWLNTDYINIMHKRSINDDFKRLLDAAMLECEKWVVNHGFENDKTFAKFTLQTQHNREIKQEVKTESKVITQIELIDV